MRKILSAFFYFIISLVIISCSSVLDGPESDAKNISEKLCKCTEDEMKNSVNILEENIEKLKKITDLNQIESIVTNNKSDLKNQRKINRDCKSLVEQEFEKIKVGYNKDWKKIRLFENKVDSLSKNCKIDFADGQQKYNIFDSLVKKLTDERSINEMPKEAKLILLDKSQKKYGFDPMGQTIFDRMLPYGNDFGNFYLLPIVKHGVAIYFYFYREKNALSPVYNLASIIVNLEKKTVTNTENIILSNVDDYNLLSAENVNIFLSPDNKYMVITDKDFRDESIGRITIFDLINGAFEKFELSRGLFGLERNFGFYLKNFTITKNNKAILKVKLKEYFSDYTIDNQTIEFDLPTRHLTSSINQN